MMKTQYIESKIVQSKPMTHGEFCDLMGIEFKDEYERQEPGYLLEYIYPNVTPNHSEYKGRLLWVTEHQFKIKHLPRYVEISFTV